MNARLYSHCLLALSCIGPLAQAADPRSLTDLSLEELLQVPVQLVYSASKYEQTVTRAPASVSIVTADDIQRYGYRTLADVMNSMRGVYISNDRNYSYVGIRGFLRQGDYNSRVLVLIDGHRTNDNLYDGGYIGLEGMIDVDRVERVEFVRGPSSSIYGSSAFFGVINVITKQAEASQGGEISGEAGNLDTYRARVRYGETINSNTDVLLSGSYYTSNGQESLYYSEFDPRVGNQPGATNNGIASNQDGEEAYSFFGRAHHGDFTLMGFLSYRFKDVPTGSFDTLFNAGIEKTRDRSSYLDLKYEHAVSDTVQVLARASYNWYWYDGDFPFNYEAPEDPPITTLFKDESRGEWVDTEWQITARVGSGHTLVAGAEYRENLRQWQTSFDDTDPRFTYFQTDDTSRNVGVYAQGEFTLTPKLLLNAGVRYDRYFQSFGGTLNPRSALIFSPIEGTTFKALYGQAFRAPSDFEQHYFLGVGSPPGLEPERIRTYELTYDQVLGHHYRLNLSGYRYTVTDLITQTTLASGDVYYQNLNRVKANGVELEITARYDSGINARASFALQSAEDSDLNQQLNNSPRQLGKLSLGLPLWKLTAGFELQYQGSVRTLAGAEERSFLLGNFTVTSPQSRHGLRVAASIYNLFDTAYSYPGSEDHVQDVIQQDGRRYRLNLTQRF